MSFIPDRMVWDVLKWNGQEFVDAELSIGREANGDGEDVILKLGNNRYDISPSQARGIAHYLTRCAEAAESVTKDQNHV